MIQTDRDLHEHDEADRFPVAEGSDQPTQSEPGGPQPTTNAADPDGQRSEEWPIPGWQWASLVAVLLGGQAVLLVVTTWTLAASASHGWATP
jgi:hypothetical protein